MISAVTGAIGLLVAFLIIFLVRKDRLHVQHGLGWIIVAACFALLGFSPSVFDHIARHLGIAYPPILAVTVVIAILVVKLLLMDIERSRLEVRNQRYIQRLAILEAEIRLLKDAGDQAGPTEEEPRLGTVATYKR